MGRLSKAKWCLLGCLIIVLILVAGSVFAPNRLSHTVKWLADNTFAARLRSITKQEEIQEDNFIEMVVENVWCSDISYQAMVILREKDGELYLPIWIGLTEANAISVVLQGVEMPRPLTSDLLCSIINETGAGVDYIVINDIQDGTFYASIILNANWTQTEIDARPSDAVAIALRISAPIYITKAVLDEAGVLLDQETDKYTTTHISIGLRRKSVT